MRESLAGNRYAKSLVALSTETNELDVVYKDMVLVANTIGASKDLSILLKSPVVKTDFRKRCI